MTIVCVFVILDLLFFPVILFMFCLFFFLFWMVAANSKRKNDKDIDMVEHVGSYHHKKARLLKFIRQLSNYATFNHFHSKQSIG